MSSLKFIILLSTLTLLCTPLHAKDNSDRWNFRLKFGGWSKHFHKNERIFRDYKFNEVHNGIGFQYWYELNDTRWNIGVDAFTNAVSELEYLDTKQMRIEAEYDVEHQRSIKISIEKQIIILEQNKQMLFAEKFQELHSRRDEAMNEIMQLEEAFVQSQDEKRRHTILAPVSGYIHQLEINTLNAVLGAADPVMQIVPESQTVLVEAIFQNKDIGFLEEGQDVRVKVDTFDFIEYGVLTGNLIEISDDAIQDENLGLVYKAKVKISPDANADNTLIENINSGMSLVVEAKTGKRSVIEFFIQPAQRVIKESLSER